MLKNNTEAELAAIKAALDSPDDKIRAKLLGSFRDELFGFAATLEVHKRIRVLIKAGKSLPSSAVFAQDTSLTESTREMLAVPSMLQINSMEDAEAILATLRKHYHGRVIFDNLLSSTDEMKKDNPDLDTVTAAAEKMLTTVRSKEEQEHLFHFGLDTNTQPIISKILNPNSKEIYIPTGFRGFDDRAGGLTKTNLQIIACHRKGGKSILCLNQAINMYFSGYSGCIVTLEMGEVEYTMRLLSNISGVPYNRIRMKKTNREENSRIHQAYLAFVQHGLTSNKKLTIWPTMSLSIAELGLLLKPYAYDFVIIDYLNLLRYDGKKDTAQHQILNEQARDCKQLTGILNCPVIAATQTDVKTGNIRYSRAIEEHADYVWTWVYGEAEEEAGIIEIEQMVSRHTERFMFRMRADYEHMRVRDHIEMPSQEEQVNSTPIGLDYMDEYM